MHGALDFGDEGCHTYQRLESFLKRYLHSCSNELRRAEPCVVVGRQFKQAFKFLVLTGSSVLILQNPPKYSKDIELTIQLNKIKAIEQIHDIPTFLNGDLKGKAQHVSLTYIHASDSKIIIHHEHRDSKLTPKDSARIGAWHSQYDGIYPPKSILASPESLHGSQNSVTFKDHFLLVEKSFSRTYSDSRLPELEKSSHTKLNSGLSTSAGNKLNTSGLSKRPLPKPLPGTESITASNCIINARAKGRSKKKQIGDSVSQGSGADIRGLHGGETLGRSMYHYDSFHRRPSKDIFPKSSGAEDKDKHFKPIDPKIMELQRSEPSSKSLGSSMSEKILGLLKGSKTKSSSLASDSSISSVSSKVGADIDAMTVSDTTFEFGKEERLDIYLLLEGSAFFQHIHSAWVSSLLKPTVLSPGSRGQLPNSDSIAEKHVDEARLLELFNDLKSEIFECKDVEGSFLLVQELSSSCYKHFLLKRLVWKSPELIKYFVDILSRNMKLQPRISQRRRADQIDYMIAIADLMTKMLKGTEHLRTRNKALHESSGSLTKSLCCLCVKSPEISSDPLLLTKNISEGAALLLSQSFEMLRDMRQSDEIASLLKDWHKSATHLLFELFQAIDQATWCLHGDKTVTLTDVVRLIEREEDSISFLDALIKDVLEFILSKSPDDDAAKCVGHLYQQYYVLKILLQLSTRFLTYVHEKYYEEIRYYVQSSMLSERLAEHGLAPMLTMLMEEVNDKIVNGFS